MEDKNQKLDASEAVDAAAQAAEPLEDEAARSASPSEAETQPAENTHAGMTRRSLVLGAGGVAALLALGGLKYVPAKPVVRPPGGQNEDLMLAACNRCEKCYEVCPHRVIKLAHMEDGIVGMRTPQMYFDAHFCDFCEEANNGRPLCVDVCPTGALALPADAQPETTIIGLAKLNTDWCLAYHLIGCRFCYDACPYEAMELDEHNRPYVIDDKCNGCGACESVCVSLKEGSITVGATARAIIVEPLEAVEALKA